MGSLGILLSFIANLPPKLLQLRTKPHISCWWVEDFLSVQADKSWKFTITLLEVMAISFKEGLAL